MALTSNKAVLNWIDEMAKMTQPDQIVWIDGSQEQIDALRAEACSTGEIEQLNQEKLPARRRTPAPPTTGWTPRRCIRSSSSCTPAL